MGNTSSCFGHYETPKIAKIQDTWLVVLHYALVFLIAAWVFIVLLWRNGDFSKKSQVVGTVRYTLQEPTMNTCDPLYPGCQLNMTNLKDLQYCAETTVNWATPYPGSVYPCHILDAQSITRLLDKAVVVATRITQYEQEMECPFNSTSCFEVYNITSQDTFYVADVEDYTLLIDHTVQASELNLYASSRDLAAGLLYVESNDALCQSEGNAQNEQGKLTTKAPCYLTPKETTQHLDYFKLKVLLGAANISLDDMYDGNSTYRETGVNIVLTIEYTNRKPWEWISNITFIYKPHVLAASTFKSYEPVYSSYPDKRVLLNRHAIRIEAIQSGYFYEFSYKESLITLAVTLTLLQVASIIVDQLMLHLFPSKKKYEELKYSGDLEYGLN